VTVKRAHSYSVNYKNTNISFIPSSEKINILTHAGWQFSPILARCSITLLIKHNVTNNSNQP